MGRICMKGAPLNEAPLPFGGGSCPKLPPDSATDLSSHRRQQTYQGEAGGLVEPKQEVLLLTLNSLDFSQHRN